MMIVSSIPLFATAQSTSGELVIALQQDMLSMNPWDPDTNDVWKNFQIGWNFEGLMAYNPDYVLYPVLAAESATGPNGADATISTDGMDITVNLRTGVTFHDGTVMDSQDVVFSYQTLAWGLFQTQVLGPLYHDDATFARYDGATGSHIGVEAVDGDTVVFHLNGDYAMFWYLTMAVPIMPHHIWSTHTQAMASADFPGYNVTGDMSWDYGYGSAVSEIDATIGTGPLMLQSWVKEQGSVIVPYEGYWDKNGTTSWGGVEYPNYPQNVNKIRFKIYTQLDVAILALQNGDVHHLPWSLTPGYYNLLKIDPNIGIEQNKDQGFFYMSYNFRKGAMMDVNFRRAVAYCVDKQYIVDRLMGGYGIKGSVPISVTNTYYVNSTVPAWIAGGDLDAAKALLDANGYTDKDGDGWRDMPNGSPINYNILTPPKDYDPIRADSGIMIEKNLKSIGLNIAAVPTSFDTIVSAAYVSLDFDMYILGWSVGSFPESYLRDFFHSESNVAVNPAGSNAAGYDNPKVDAMIDEMETTMDTEDRAKLIKDICGVTMMDLPYNTLYYRTNIEAYRKDIWSGWIPAFGTIYNGFSLFNLAAPTEGGGGGGGGGASEGTTTLEAGINVASNAGAGQTISGSIVATDVTDTAGVITNVPSSGATVRITTSSGNYINLTTNVNGVATFDLTIPYQRIDSIRIDANVSKSGAWTNINKTINVEFTNRLAHLSLSTDNGVIAPNTTTNVTAKVTDEMGDAVAGVKVYVDTALMFGTVDNAVKTTGTDGTVVFVYTAPPVTMLPNTHRFEQFKANITALNAIVPEIQSASLIIGISSDLFDWHDLDITGVTNYVIDNDATTTAIPSATTITLNVTDQDGVLLPDIPVTITLSEDATVIGADALRKSTNATGAVTFTLTVNGAYTGSGSVVATFNTSKAYSIRDSVAIYIRNNQSFTMPSYHVNVTHVTRQTIFNVNGAANTTSITVRLLNNVWAPVSGMDVWMGLSDDSIVEADAEFKPTNATGYANFNITCVANGSANLSIGFGVEGSVNISQGYNLKVNKTGTPVAAELIFGPAAGGEMGPWNLANAPILGATVYLKNGAAWTKLTETTDYTITLATGAVAMVNQLTAGDSLYAYYNYSVPYLSELVFGPATGGEMGPWNLANAHVSDATVYVENAGTWAMLTETTDYTINMDTGAVAMVNQLTAGDILYAYYNYSTPENNETVIAGATGGEMGPWILFFTPVVNATVYRDNAGTWTKLVDTVDYNLVLATGSLSMTAGLTAGDSIYIYYNWSTPVANETLFAGPAVGGETGLIGDLNNAPIANANILLENTGVWTQLASPADYTLNPATGELTLNIILHANDNIYAHYNRSVTVANETLFAGPAVGGQTGLIGNLDNTPIADATIYIENTGVWTKLASPADYTLNMNTGALTLNIVLHANDNVMAFYNYTPQHTLRVTSVSSYYIDSNPFGAAVPGYSNVVVRLLDGGGNPVAGRTVTAIPWGEISVVKIYNTTDVNGYAYFNVTSASNTGESALLFFKVNQTAGMTESVTFYNAPYTPGYAADIDFEGVAEHDSSMVITATVYDAAGNPAPGVRCQFFIPPTAEGIPGVFQNGDEWGWTEYGDEWDMGDWAGYLGSWFRDNATYTDANGHLIATIDTPSFIADTEIPLQFGVGGTGVAAAFNYSANNWWMEYYPEYGPPLTDDGDVYYWEEASFTMIDQVILFRAPIATLTAVAMDQTFMYAADNETTVSLTFQDMEGPLNAIDVNFGVGTSRPDILDEGPTSATGVYTYDYTADVGDFDAGIGFTTMLTDSGYAKFPFNFYLPYLTDGTTAKALVVSAVPALYSVTVGDNVTLNVTVTDEYGRLLSGATITAGTVTATTNAGGEAHLVIPTTSETETGLYTVDFRVSRGTMRSNESASVNMKAAGIVMVEITVGPVLDGKENPVEGALVTMKLVPTVLRQAETYSGTTGTTGHTTFEVPETWLGQMVNVTITKTGYRTVWFETMLNADGTLAGAIPALELLDDGGDNTMMIILIVVILVVVVVAVMLMRKKGEEGTKAEEPAEEAAPEETAEQAPEETELPAEETPAEEEIPSEDKPQE